MVVQTNVGIFLFSLANVVMHHAPNRFKVFFFCFGEGLGFRVLERVCEGWGWIFWVSFLFSMCPSSSHQIFKRFPMMFPIAPHFLSHLFCPNLFSFHLICGPTLTLSLIWMLKHVGLSKQQNKHSTTQKTLSCHL